MSDIRDHNFFEPRVAPVLSVSELCPDFPKQTICAEKTELLGPAKGARTIWTFFDADLRTMQSETTFK
jgi:hypothetical protein